MAIAFGVIGFALEKRGFSVVTIVLGAVLGPIIEYNVRLGLAYSNGDWSAFVSTWPRLLLAAAIVLLVANELTKGVRRLTQDDAPKESRLTED